MRLETIPCVTLGLVLALMQSSCGKSFAVERKTRDAGIDADSAIRSADAGPSEWDRFLEALGLNAPDADSATPQSGTRRDAATLCAGCIGTCVFGLCIPADSSDSGSEPPPEVSGTRAPASDADEPASGGQNETAPAKVAAGAWCMTAEECESTVCSFGVCQAARCDDRVCNGDETTATCADDCGSYCGDGAVNGAEACDDSNRASGDGCSDKCQLEDGFDCGHAMVQLSKCSQIDACLDAPCAAQEVCQDSPPPAAAGAEGRKCVTDRRCGNGVCSASESLSRCPADCSTCGDGRCSGPESAATCAEDCTQCGDGLCTGAEAAAVCPRDCTRCGDGLCTGAENAPMCPGDCTRCGDDLCTGNETAESCARDCTRCGDGTCSVGENVATCAADCSMCGDDLCSGGETVEVCPQDCTRCGDGMCSAGETVQSCPGDCAVCGDGSCTGPETAANCPTDCTRCGDGVCTGGESPQACSADCK